MIIAKNAHPPTVFKQISLYPLRLPDLRAHRCPQQLLVKPNELDETDRERGAWRGDPLLVAGDPTVGTRAIPLVCGGGVCRKLDRRENVF